MNLKNVLFALLLTALLFLISIYVQAGDYRIKNYPQKSCHFQTLSQWDGPRAILSCRFKQSYIINQGTTIAYAIRPKLLSEA